MNSKFDWRALAPVAQGCRCTSSSLRVDQKDSETALSQHCPGAVRLWRIPWASSSSRNAPEVNWAESSGRRNTSTERSCDANTQTSGG